MNIHLGLVTHPLTRFLDSNWEYYKQVMFMLESERVITKLSISVSSKNYVELDQIPLYMLIRARWANLSLNIYWHAYLNSEFKFRRIQKWVSAIIDLTKFSAKLFQSKSFRIKETKSFVRHQNIICSHLAIFAQAKLNDSDWALILEDDVCDSDFEIEILKVLRYIMKSDLSDFDLFINLSDSLSYKQLGVSEIVIESKLNSKSPDFWITTKTFHNTTAANLYNRRFISRFNSEFVEEINWCLKRAIPIDWILNHLVLQDVGSDIKSIHMTKPIFRQLSITLGNT